MFSLHAIAVAARRQFGGVAAPSVADAPRRLPAVRAVRAADAEAMREFVQQALSPAARRCRFHGALQGCSAALLRHLTRVDGVQHVAFVATVPGDDGAERVVGEARYVACRGDERNAGCAEFAIAVADDWQGRGLADRLMAALFDRARDAGLRWLYGDVLGSNERMLGFTRRLGFSARSGSGDRDDDGDGIVRVERGVATLAPPRREAPWRGWLGARLTTP